MSQENDPEQAGGVDDLIVDLESMRDLIAELDKDCVDDPGDVLNTMACYSHSYVQALNKAIKILREKR